MLKSAGATKAKPFTQREALRYVGVGPASLPYLLKVGLVTSVDPDIRFPELPTRTQNVLRRTPFKSKQAVADAILAGEFIIDEKQVLLRCDTGKYEQIPKCGPALYEEIAAWAGVDPHRRAVRAPVRLTDVAGPGRAELRNEAITKAIEHLEKVCPANPIAREEYGNVIGYLREQSARLQRSGRVSGNRCA